MLTGWNNGYSRSWKKTVFTSSFNMMVPPRITITTFEATSMTDCHNDGLAVQ
jgi:hypothetical protein